MIVSKGTFNYDPISPYSLGANIPNNVINSAIFEPQKWLELLERVSLLSLVMHAMPSMPSMQPRVGRACSEDSMEREG